MAKRQKPIKSAAPPVLASTPVASAPIEKKRIKQIAERIVDSAVDRALDLFWLGVAAIVTPIAVAIWLYVISGRAVWVYPYLNFALGFISACLVLISASWFLFYVKSRRRKVLEQVKNLQFISHEKGFLDFIVNKEKSERQLNTTLLAISKEITGIGKAATRFSRRVNPNTPFATRQRFASKLAKAFDSHSNKLQQESEVFEKINDALIESNTGFIKWLDPTNTEHQTILMQSHQVFNSVLLALQSSLPTIEGLRDSAISQKGISQDLNTAINQLTHVLKGLIVTMRKNERLWQNLIKMIDNKISI